MNTDVSSIPTETVKNYSEKQEQILRDNSPMNLAIAKKVGKEIGKSYQSVIAKVGNMGLKYIPKPAPRKKAVQTTKDEIVVHIQAMIDRDCDGLSKATRQALLNVENGLQHLKHSLAELAAD